MKNPSPKRTARGGRPTKQESEKMAAQIIDVARDLFISQGFSATTMEQVVAGCGIGKDTLYRRYSTKDDLFLTVVQQALKRAVEWFEATDAQSPDEPLQRVRHLARWFLEANLDQELLALKREAFIEAMRGGPLFQEDPFTPRLIEAISAAQNTGAIRSEDASFMASQLVATVVLGPNNEALMGSTAMSDPKVREAWFEKSWALFLNGAGT